MCLCGGHEPNNIREYEMEKKVDPKLIERLYNTGMQLADCLRLLGEHEAAHDTELWVLAMVKDMKGGAK